MADEDVEVNADEGSIDSGEEEVEAKKSFLKSKLLLIIAGVFLLLLLAGGGYYFFFASEEEVLEMQDNIEQTTQALDETASTELVDEDESQIEQTDLEPMAEQMGFDEAILNEDGEPINTDDSETSSQDSTNDIAEMQQQNQKMKQHIEALEAKLNQIESTLQSQKNIPADAEILPLQYSDNFDYQQDFSDSSAMRSPSGPPPPKPSWGEFDRINRK